MLFLLILCFGLAVRLYRIGDESAWCDEVLTLTCFPADGLRAFLRCAFEVDARPSVTPAYYVVAYFWSCLAGGALPEMRLLSVFAGLGSMVLVFLTGKALYSVRAGLVAMAGLAASPAMTYYDQEVRFYAVLVFFALASMYGFLRALQTGRARWWVLHGLGNALLLWSHAFAPVLFAGQGLFLLFARARRWRLWLGWGGGHVLLLACFFAWVLLLGYDFAAHSQAYNDVPPDWRDLAAAWLVFAGGRFSELDPAAWMPGGLSLDEVLGVLALVLVVWISWTAWCAQREDTERGAGDGLGPLERWGFPLFWLVAPPCALLLASCLWRPCFLFRYVLFSLPALWLLVAAGVEAIRPAALRRIALVLLLGGAVYQNVGLPRPFRPDYATAAGMVQQSERPRAVHALKLFNGIGMEYALEGAAPLRIFEGFPEFCRATVETACQGKTVWAVFYRWARFAPFEERLATAGLRFERYTLGGQPPLIVYAVPGAGGSKERDIDAAAVQGAANAPVKRARDSSRPPLRRRRDMRRSCKTESGAAVR